MNSEIQCSAFIGLALLGLIALRVDHLLINLCDLISDSLARALHSLRRRRMALFPILFHCHAPRRNRTLANRHARPP
jgi:hypothetical protein